MKAALLDRDGVINQKVPEGEYVAHWEGIHFLPGVFSAVRALEQAGFKIIIVTNQRGVALGKVRSTDLEEIHQRLREEFSRRGIHLTDIYVCPHDLADRCSCRKPNPGMLLRAAEEHGIDLAASWMIGDAPSDIEAGRRAGCKTVRIQAVQSPYGNDHQADISSPNLVSAVHSILQLSKVSDQS